MAEPRDDSDLLLCGVMAVRFGFVGLDQATAAIKGCESGTRDEFMQLLETRGDLTAEQRGLLSQLLDAYLASHDHDSSAGLESLQQSDVATDIAQRLLGPRIDATVDFTPSDSSHPTDAGEALRRTDWGERFQKIHSHASGGLGHVYLAHDQQVKRQVALKELKDHHADDPEKQRRFLLEGEVTGALEHPNIVPVYSLGFDGNSRPFYAMRFIRGRTLRSEIKEAHAGGGLTGGFDTHSVAFRRIVQRLVDVCYAVEYAHSRGVLHRDIKPSNIMLGRYGEAYLVDWGLACLRGKAHEDSEAHTEAPLEPGDLSGSTDTQMGHALGTPSFMSPEQAAGDLEALGPGTDVYSLGATFYYALTNRAPFEGDNVLELLEEVKQGTFAVPRMIDPAIPKKLERICLKAMSLKPSDRYSSAAALAGDLECWLSDEPIEASPDSLSERVMRAVRRHRTAFVAGATTLLAVTAISVAATLIVNAARQRAEDLADENAVLAATEEQARKLAEERFVHARETVDVWLTGFSEAMRRVPGVSVFRERMLQRAASEYEQFVQENQDDPSLQLERARTLLRLGDIRRALAEFEEAGSLYRQAVEAIEIEDGEEAALVKAKALDRLGLWLAEQGALSEAEQSFEEAVASAKPFVAAGESGSAHLSALSAALIDHGNLLLAMDRLDECVSKYTAAARALEAAVADSPDELDLRRQQAMAETGLGRAYLRRGEPERASASFQEAIRFYNASLILQPDEPRYREAKASAHLYSASAMRQLGDYRAEASDYQTAVKDFERLAEAQPESVVYKENLALTQTDLGQLWLSLYETGLARAELETAEQTLSTLQNNYPGVPRFKEEVAVASDTLAHALLLEARYGDAADHSLRAEAFLAELIEQFPDVPEYRQRLAVCRSHLAEAYYRQGMIEEALDNWQAAIGLLEEAALQFEKSVVFSNDAALVHSKLGDALWDQEDREGAAVHFETASKIWREIRATSADPTHLHNAAWFFAACPSEAVRNPGLAASFARAALQASEQNERYVATLALAMVMLGEPQNAVSAIDNRRGDTEPGGFSLFVLSLAHHALGQPEEAEESQAEAVLWMKERAPGDWELLKLRQRSSAAPGEEPAQAAE